MFATGVGIDVACVGAPAPQRMRVFLSGRRRMATTSFVARLLSGRYVEIVASGYVARERCEARIDSLSDVCLVDQSSAPRLARSSKPGPG